jgi:hypothetical protein
VETKEMQLVSRELALEADMVEAYQLFASA